MWHGLGLEPVAARVLTLAILALAWSAPSPAYAQGLDAFAACPTTREGTPAVPEIIAEFRSEFPRRPGGPFLGSHCLHTLFLEGSRYPLLLEEALDSLQALAIDGDRPMRRGATIQLGIAGSAREGLPAVPGILDRLLQVYRSADNSLVRSLVAGAMIHLPERSRVAQFLAGLASQEPGHQEFTGAAHRGVYLLSQIGPEGERELRRLWEEGLVRDSRARLELAVLAERGFRPRR